VIYIIVLPAKLAEKKHRLLLVHFIVSKRLQNSTCCRASLLWTSWAIEKIFQTSFEAKMKSCTEEKAQIDLEATYFSNPSSDISAYLNDQVCSSLLHSFAV